jgi:regulatory protein
MDDYDDFTLPPEPPKVTVLSDLKGKFGTADSLKKNRSFKKGVPKPLSKKKPLNETGFQKPQSGFKAQKGSSFKNSSGFDDESGKGLGKPVKGFKAPSGLGLGKSKSEKPVARGPKKAKEPTPQRLKNIAEYQISQREMSSGGLRDLLKRRMLRFLNTLPSDEVEDKKNEIEANIETLIEKFISERYIDDARFSELRIRSWRNQGWGLRRIELELRKKGISPEILQVALREVDLENVDIDDDSTRIQEADHLAAQTLAQKKRLGPYRTTPMPDDFKEAQKVWRREAGMLARAGFGLDIIQQILMRPPDEDDL